MRSRHWSTIGPFGEFNSHPACGTGSRWLVDTLNALQSLGFTLPTPAYLAGVVLFSIIGFAAYRYGNKMSLPTTKWIGIALMLYPYVIAETWLLYSVGAALCVGLYVFRR